MTTNCSTNFNRMGASRAVASFALLLMACGGSTPEGTFIMPVGDVYSQGAAVHMTGMANRGSVRAGDTLELVGLKDTQRFTVDKVMVGTVIVAQGDAGQMVDVIVLGADRNKVERGQVLASAGTLKAHKRLKASITLSSTASGGPSNAVKDGYKPQIRIWLVEALGAISGLPSGTLAPGSSADVTIELNLPLAANAGLAFEIVEGTRVVGTGTIASFLD